MNSWKITIPSIFGFIAAWSLLSTLPAYPTDTPGFIYPTESIQDQKENEKILVELFLAPEQKKNIEGIKSQLKSISIKRVNIQFFRLGHPPQNIAIGRNVSASTARLAIELATLYNGGVKYLLAEYRFSPNYIAIGTSAFDEASQIPVLPQDLERLANPTLSTLEFHALYRKLTGEDKGPSADY
jgi:hypothetical protein